MYNYKARVVRVVDGDTLLLEVDLGFNISLRQSIRLARINAPEKADEGGAEATSTLAALCNGAEVFIIVKSRDPYGRYVAEVTHKDINLSDEMMRLGCAKAYHERV